MAGGSAAAHPRSGTPECISQSDPQPLSRGRHRHPCERSSSRVGRQRRHDHAGERAQRIRATLRYSNMTALSLLAFRFYLRDLFFACADYAQSPVISRGLTNYTELVQTSYECASARSGHVCFVTFNYDLLLDEACVAETRYAIGLPPTSDGRLSLLRPHGAVAWEWQSTELGLFGHPGLPMRRTFWSSGRCRMFRNATCTSICSAPRRFGAEREQRRFRQSRCRC